MQPDFNCNTVLRHVSSLVLDKIQSCEESGKREAARCRCWTLKVAYMSYKKKNANVGDIVKKLIFSEKLKLRLICYLSLFCTLSLSIFCPCHFNRICSTDNNSFVQPVDILSNYYQQSRFCQQTSYISIYQYVLLCKACLRDDVSCLKCE